MIELRPYQRKLVNDTKQAIKDGYHAPCIVAPCGAGKSVMIADIIYSATAKKQHVLFLVHRRELISQIENTLRNFGVDMDYVTLGMVQTVVRRLDKYPKFRLIVIDENHHVLANSYKKIINYFNALVVGFTATPIRLNGDGLGDVNDKLIEGVTAKWLIDNGYLAPYKLYSIDLTDKSMLKKNSTGDYSSDSIDKSLGNVIYGDVIAHYNRCAPGKQAILYAHSVEYSKTIAEAFCNAGIRAKSIDGKTPADEREKTIQAFRDKEIQVLCNVDLIGEGFDVPDCSCVILMRPTASLSLFIQQAMRPMRFKEGKTAIILDHVGNVIRHGLPDEEREWHLGKNKKKRNKKEVTPFPIWECPICMGVTAKSELVIEDGFVECHLCGNKTKIVIQKTEKEIQAEVELKEYEEKIYYANKDISTVRSFKELQKIGKAKGYKPSWAAFKAKALNLPDTPRWVKQYKQQNFKFNF